MDKNIKSILVFIAEPITIREVLKMTKDRNINKIVIESDSQLVIKIYKGFN